MKTVGQCRYCDATLTRGNTTHYSPDAVIAWMTECDDCHEATVEKADGEV